MRRGVLSKLKATPNQTPTVKLITRLILAASVLILGAAARADTLTLKNGTVLNGKYLNNTGESVRFETVTGVQTIASSEILGMSTDPSSAAMVASTPAPYSPTVTNVTIPTGTVLLVQMMDGVSSQSEPGANFTAKLQNDLVANGVVAAPAGSIVYGKVQAMTPADWPLGRSSLDLRLTQMLANGIPVTLATSNFTPHIEPEGKKAVAGESPAPLKSGQTHTIPPGALLEFTLTQPATVSMVR